MLFSNAQAIGIDQRQHDGAGVRLPERPIEQLKHNAVIGQPGQRVLARELADSPQARGQESRLPLNEADGAQRANTEHDADGAGEAPQPIHGADQCAVRRPAEPARDAAASVVHRLHLAARGVRLVAVEVQIRQGGEPRDKRQPRFVEVEIAAAEGAVQFVDRALERGVAHGGEPMILAHGNGKARHRAGQHRRRQGGQHIGCNLRSHSGQGRCRPWRRPCRGRRWATALSPPKHRPPSPGYRSGLHTQRPVPKIPVVRLSRA